MMAKDGKQSAGDRRSLPLGEKCEKKHLFDNFLMHNKFQHKLESGQKDKSKIRIPVGFRSLSTAYRVIPVFMTHGQQVAQSIGAPEEPVSPVQSLAVAISRGRADR